MTGSAMVAMSMGVTVIGVAMVLVGAASMVATVMLWRSASVDSEVLAPLEVMADRRFARADDADRAGILDGVRPEGAEAPVLTTAAVALMREPASEPERPFKDPFPHDDDAVDIVPAAPPVIDPLLRRNTRERKSR